MNSAIITVSSPSPGSPESLIHPEQHRRGIELAWMRFERATEIYQIIDDVCQDKRKFPIVTFMVSSGETMELDLNVIPGRNRDDEARLASVRTFFQPWRSWSVRECREAVRELHDFTCKLAASILGDASIEVGEIGDYDQCLIATRKCLLEQLHPLLKAPVVEDDHFEFVSAAFRGRVEIRQLCEAALGGENDEACQLAVARVVGLLKSKKSAQVTICLMDAVSLTGQMVRFLDPKN